MPVWFVLEDEKLYLLPIQGSDMQGTRMCSRTRRLGLMREVWGTGFQVTARRRGVNRKRPL
jgi:hypothetical protein